MELRSELGVLKSTPSWRTGFMERLRLALVQRLDQAAQTSALAARLRQEVDKTRLLLALRARGEPASERRLEELSARQLEALRSSSRAAVESFMFFAYRRIPSAELSEYAALYEQAPV